MKERIIKGMVFLDTDYYSYDREQGMNDELFRNIRVLERNMTLYHNSYLPMRGDDYMLHYVRCTFPQDLLYGIAVNYELPTEIFNYISTIVECLVEYIESSVILLNGHGHNSYDDIL